MKTVLLSLCLFNLIFSPDPKQEDGIHPNSMKGVELQLEKFAQLNNLNSTTGMCVIYTDMIVQTVDAVYRVDFMIGLDDKPVILSIAPDSGALSSFDHCHKTVQIVPIVEMI